MFTGLIEEVGSITEVNFSQLGAQMRVRATKIMEGIQLGDSIAIDGACMTVVHFDENSFGFEVSPESLSKTHFATFQPGQKVNLERPLMPTSRLGGHYVTGHVDGLARIVSRELQGNSEIFTFELEDPSLSAFLVPKGSVAILGISLTVNTVCQNQFSVAIIPHTLKHTSLGNYEVGDRINVETDLLGKYVQRLLQTGSMKSPYTDPSVNSKDLPYTMDDPALVPAMDAFGVTTKKATTATIRTGGWFNFREEES